MVCQWFDFKTTGTVFFGLTSKSVATIFFGLILKLVATVSPGFGLKTGGGGFPDLCLKIDCFVLMIWTSKSP
jgi:hypothetical protein